MKDNRRRMLAEDYTLPSMQFQSPSLLIWLQRGVIGLVWRMMKATLSRSAQRAHSGDIQVYGLSQFLLSFVFGGSKEKCVNKDVHWLNRVELYLFGGRIKARPEVSACIDRVMAGHHTHIPSPLCWDWIYTIWLCFHHRYFYQNRRLSAVWLVEVEVS